MKKSVVNILTGIIVFCLLQGTLAAAIPSGLCYAFFGTSFTSEFNDVSQGIDRQGDKRLRISLALSFNLAMIGPSYNHMVKSWGKPDGKFHLKDDWSGDNLALNDEVSHLLVSYKLTQALHSGYRTLGFSEKTARILGLTEAAFIVTAVEYPIDAYNPSQGFGISDLIFDYAGILMAYFKISESRLADWDLKTSVKSFRNANHQVIGDMAEDYDNYIYWLTFRKTPAVFGLGYSTSHPEIGKVNKEFYLALGTTLPDILRPVSNKLANALKWAEVYYFNVSWRFLTLD
jgi:hypothetical protein